MDAMINALFENMFFTVEHWYHSTQGISPIEINLVTGLFFYFKFYKQVLYIWQKKEQQLWKGSNDNILPIRLKN